MEPLGIRVQPATRKFDLIQKSEMLYISMICKGDVLNTSFSSVSF